MLTGQPAPHLLRHNSLFVSIFAIAAGVDLEPLTDAEVPQNDSSHLIIDNVLGEENQLNEAWLIKPTEW